MLVHAYYKDLLGVRSVEDPDPSPLRQALGVTPEKVVVEILRRGLLERENLAALRIYSRHDVLDGAVLAGRVHRLEYEQQRPAILGVEYVLLLCEPLGAALQKFGRLALAHRKATGVAGIEVLQFEAFAFVMRNGSIYFSMRSRISFLAMAQTPFRGAQFSVSSAATAKSRTVCQSCLAGITPWRCTARA